MGRINKSFVAYVSQGGYRADEMSDEPVAGVQCRGIEKPLLPPARLYLGGEMSGTSPHPPNAVSVRREGSWEGTLNRGRSRQGQPGWMLALVTSGWWLKVLF